MGSHSIDSGTQQASSAAAQQVSQQQAANATQQQQNSNSAFKSLFGTQGPNGQYSGGAVSSSLNPASLTQTGLSGTFKNAYNAAANTNAQGAQESVATAQQQQANRGGGAAPAGFNTDQARQAYQTQAGNNAANYTNLSQAQLAQNTNLYQYATGLLNNYGTSQGQLAQGNNSGAAGTNTSLYGTASQQVPSVAGSLLSAATGLGAAYLGAPKAPAAPCWIAEALYGVDSPFTEVIRAYLMSRRSVVGKAIVGLYRLIGRPIARAIWRRPWVGAPFRPLFDWALARALEKVA